MALQFIVRKDRKIRKPLPSICLTKQKQKMRENPAIVEITRSNVCDLYYSCQNSDDVTLAKDGFSHKHRRANFLFENGSEGSWEPWVYLERLFKDERKQREQKVCVLLA